MSNYEVVVIGSGPGGYVAAIRAAHHGLKTALVEKDRKLGGTCLLRGCIPTKSLLHSADLLQSLRTARAHGVVAGEVGLDFAAVQKAREKVVTKSAAGVAYLMKQNKIDVHTGVGRLIDGGTVEVQGEGDSVRLTAKHVVLATGSVPRRLPFIDVDGSTCVTSDELLAVRTVPESLIVLGGGPVGVEFASAFSRFGAKCTVVEMLEHLLPLEDVEISTEFENALRKRGIACHTRTRVQKAEVVQGKVVATLDGPDGPLTESAAMMLVAVGRAPYTEGLGLTAAGVDLRPDGFVPVDRFMRTSVPGIYAIGDIVPTPQLAHTASAEALLAVDHLAGLAVEPINYRHNPGATYADPEVASVGLTEQQAKAEGYDVKVGRFPFSALGKARILGQTEGLVKIVAERKYDEVLGVHIVGPHATDLIAEACVALRLECTTAELARTIHAHPTLPEAVLEAAHAASGRAIHL